METLGDHALLCSGDPLGWLPLPLELRSAVLGHHSPPSRCLSTSLASPLAGVA